MALGARLTGSGSPGARQFEQVVGGADEAPLGSDLFEASEMELPEPSSLLDLTEHRLDGLLSKSVT